MSIVAKEVWGGSLNVVD